MQIQYSCILCTQRRLKNSQHTLHTHHNSVPGSALGHSFMCLVDVVDSGVPPCRSSCPDPWIPGVSQPGSGRWPPPSGGLPPLLGSVWPPPSGRGFPVLPAGRSAQLTCSLRTQGTAREGARAASRCTAPKLTLQRPLPASDLPWVSARSGPWPLAASSEVPAAPRRTTHGGHRCGLGEVGMAGLGLIKQSRKTLKSVRQILFPLSWIAPAGLGHWRPRELLT